MVEAFVSSIVSCVGITEIPGITEPGLPNLALGCFLGTMAGITFVASFIPPTPLLILNLKLPTIDIFLKPFMAAIVLPDGPGIDFGFFSLPGRGAYAGMPPIKFGYPIPSGWDASGIIRFIFAIVQTILGIFTGIVESILNLSPKIPDVGFIMNIMMKVGLELGLPPLILANFGKCLALAVLGLIKSILGL